MIRKDFLKRLEYLIQDMDENDREDALAYYRDYMDEAGIREEDNVDALFESPEKIAMTIRASLNGEPDIQIESDETGFKNSYAESASYVPEVYGEKVNQERMDDKKEKSVDDAAEKERNFSGKKTSNLGKILLIIVLAIMAAPFLLGIAGASVGCVIGGIVLLVMSVIVLMTSVTKGVFMLGTAFLMIAAGILFTMLTVFVFKRILPGLIRGIVGMIRKVFHRNGGRSL